MKTGLGYTDEDLNDIYDKKNGYCNYCGKRLSFLNYGIPGARGAWQVEHSNPRARGGSDYLRNLFPACIDCNLDKGTRKGTSYKRDWEPATIGGTVVKALGLPEGFLGSSRRKRRR